MVGQQMYMSMGNVLVRHPHGFLLEITIPALMYVMHATDITQGGCIQGEWKWVASNETPRGGAPGRGTLVQK